MLSPELETLDQLLGGELPLATIRRIYPDQKPSSLGYSGCCPVVMLICFLMGQRFRVGDGESYSIGGEVIREGDSLELRITEQGARRIA